MFGLYLKEKAKCDNNNINLKNYKRKIKSFLFLKKSKLLVKVFNNQTFIPFHLVFIIYIFTTKGYSISIEILFTAESDESRNI